MTDKEFLVALIETVLNTQTSLIFGYAVLGGITGLLFKKTVWGQICCEVAILITAIATFYEKIEMAKPASGFWNA